MAAAAMAAAAAGAAPAADAPTLLRGRGQGKPKNVLLIVVDDLRPDLGSYNATIARTPNMDRVAATGLTFSRAYVQYALCGPSRNSFMSGRRPDTTRVWSFTDHFREADVGAEWKSLPEYFKANGMLTLGSGKLFHPTLPPDNDWPRSWSADHGYFSPECLPEGKGGLHSPQCNHSVPPPAGVACGTPVCGVGVVCGTPAGQCPYPNGHHECITGSDQTLCLANTSADETRFEFQMEDQRIRDSCAGNLEIAAKAAKPGGEAAKGFFIGCGFHKPHVPWIVPHEFIELFPKDLGDIPLAPNTHAPANMPDVAWHYPYDVKGFHEHPFNGTCKETLSRIYRRGYAAAVSYTDYNIGVLLDKLDALGLTSSTLVAVVGDHGFHLGDHDTWAKMTNFEAAVRIPLIIRCPWKTAAAGKITGVLAEAVDLYPTLAALAGLPAPLSQGEEVNGTNLEPVFDAPGHGPTAAALKTAAFSQLAKANLQNPFQIGAASPPGGPARNTTEIMGYTVRVDGWRYTCWFKFDHVAIVPITTAAGIIGRELYDHRADDVLAVPGAGETVNVVAEKAHASVVAELHAAVVGYIRLYSHSHPNR